MKRIMKTAGWIFIVIGALAFLGAASKGNSVFGPLFWIGFGGVLLYLKREREENKEESSGSVPSVKKESIKPIEKEMSMVTEPLEKTTSVSRDAVSHQCRLRLKTKNRRIHEPKIDRQTIAAHSYYFSCKAVDLIVYIVTFFLCIHALFIKLFFVFNKFCRAFF